MAKTKYIVTKAGDETESMLPLYSENYVPYLTEIYDNEGNKTGAGWFKANDVMNDETIIPEDDFDIWWDAVHEYTVNYNKKLAAMAIEYEITDKDENGKYKYNKKLDGKVVATDKWGWYSELYTKAEEQAWVEAVTKYKKEHGEKCIDDIITETKEKIKKAIDKLDAEKEEMMPMTPPGVAKAIESATEDPCKFIEELMMGIANGTLAPNLKDAKEYVLKATKHNAKATANNLRNSLAEQTRAALEPVEEEVDKFREYFRECEAADQELTKRLSSIKTVFDVCVYNAVNIDLSDIAGMGVELDAEILSEILSGEIDDTYVMDDSLILRESVNAKYGDHPSDTIKNNVRSAIQNCFQPIVRAWNVYCRKKGWKEGIGITSGWRGPKHNASVRGAANSNHLYGYAMDFHPLESSQTNTMAYFIYEFCKNSEGRYSFNQLLNEFKKLDNGNTSHWIHIGWKSGNGGQERKFYYDYDANHNNGRGKVLSL